MGIAGSGLSGALLCLLIGYVFGNFLTAVPVTRRLAGRDVFALGSCNPGMANVGKQLGTKAAALVLAGDIIKTMIPVVLCMVLAGERSISQALGGNVLFASFHALMAGLGVSLGHSYPAWHGFKGGKSVTSTLTAMILASPVTGIACGLIGFAAIRIFSGLKKSRGLKIGAILMPALYTVCMLLTRQRGCAGAAAVMTLLAALRNVPENQAGEMIVPDD